MVHTQKHLQIYDPSTALGTLRREPTPQNCLLMSSLWYSFVPIHITHTSTNDDDDDNDI